MTHDLQQRRAARLADKDRDDAHSITPRFPDNCNTLALGVTLPGGPYPEAAETRRRLRYAVLAALHTEDYAPADEKHIGYFRTHEETPITQPPTQPKPQPPVTAQTTAKGSLIAYQLPPKDTKATTDNDGTGQSGGTGSNDGNGADAPLPPIIPFEQFDRYATHGCADAEPQKHIVVMWLDEDLLTAGRMPIASLDLLRSMILRSAQTTGSSLEEPKFALLGPDDSTMLVAMAQEAVHPPPATAKSSQTDKPGRRHFDFTIYNFGATADDEYVRKLAGSTKSSLAEVFLQANLEYHQLVNADRDLAGVIGAELRRRDNDLKTSLSPANSENISAEFHRAHVALISEWDTVYGEYLPKSVAHAFGASDHGEGWGAADWVTPFRYLRGLDGRLPDLRWIRSKPTPNTNDSDGDQEADKQTSATPDNAERFEGAEGQSQFDYLRRLAAEVSDRDAELRRTGQGHFAAIGVLGSDVYDKLLILQALRPQFPEALFFTTDLDALLLPQNKTRYTRNLLVASSFGLSLAASLQTDVPPFRSTYQTSIFRAARLAVREQLSGAAIYCGQPTDQMAASDCWQAQPVLFQIGRSAPQALPTKTGRNVAQPGSNDSEVIALLSAQPDARALFPQLRAGTYVGVSLLLAALLLALLLSSRNVRRFCFVQSSGNAPTLPRRLRCSHVTTLFLGTLIFSFGFWRSWPTIGELLTHYGYGEPMSLIEGVSLWPTIGLRVLGVGLGVWLIFISLRSLEDNKTETRTEMELPPLQRQFFFDEWKKLELRDQPTCFRLARIASLFWHSYPPSSNSFTDLESGFAGDRRARCTRAGIATLAMLILGSILTVLWGPPNVPARGPVARELYLIVTIGEALATIFLTFRCRRQPVLAFLYQASDRDDHQVAARDGQQVPHHVRIGGGRSRRLDGHAVSRQAHQLHHLLDLFPIPGAGGFDHLTQ